MPEVPKAGRKGRNLEVRAQRAPRLLVWRYFWIYQNICQCVQEEAFRHFTVLQPLDGHFASQLLAILDSAVVNLNKHFVLKLFGFENLTTLSLFSALTLRFSIVSVVCQCDGHFTRAPSFPPLQMWPTRELFGQIGSHIFLISYF